MPGMIPKDWSPAQCRRLAEWFEGIIQPALLKPDYKEFQNRLLDLRNVQMALERAADERK